jgi:hypothetical protein
LRNTTLFFLAAVLAIAAMAPLSSAATGFGHSRITLERTWTVTNASGVPIEFHGALSVNNSNQRIITVSTGPEMEQEMKDGVLWVVYQGTPSSDRFPLTATIVADVDYDTRISSDSGLPPAHPLGAGSAGSVANGSLGAGNTSASNLTMPDGNITSQAYSLIQDDSSLETLRALTEWVHGNITYDIRYWGKQKTAQETFRERRGVCVEYTQLLMAMARSLGFDTRYVSGYIYDNIWQQHAWAEIYVPGYGWIPADATFGQLGILDDTHFGMHYAQDQSQTYDTLASSSAAVNMEVSDELSIASEAPDTKGVSISMSVDKGATVIDVLVNNSRPEYVFGSYGLQMPDGYGDSVNSIILLHPNQTLHSLHGLNHSFLVAGLTYTVPIRASFNDAKIEKDIKMDGPELPQQNPGANSNAAPEQCWPAALLLLSSAFLAVASHPTRMAS